MSITCVLYVAGLTYRTTVATYFCIRCLVENIAPYVLVQNTINFHWKSFKCQNTVEYTNMPENLWFHLEISGFAAFILCETKFKVLQLKVR